MNIHRTLYSTIYRIRSCLLRIKHKHLCRHLSNNCEGWKRPHGYDTGISCYNRLTKSNVPLILQNENVIYWYTCGPTVYDEMHIGHAYCYMQFDIIRRILEKYFNYDIILTMGITDIDDKIIAKSREENMTIQHIVKHFEQDFFADLGKLKIIPPKIITRVTDYIPQIIDFCDQIYKKEYAYLTSKGTLYFDMEKYGNFGKLSDMGLEEEKESIDPEKKDYRDFALWKAVKPGEPWWNSPWGKGRPGWHIECSAMASHIFGSQLDIHSGGKDLIFPHHENEERQSEVYHNTTQWANYWIHTGHLHLSNDVKMAKSLNNTISVKDFLKEYTPNDFRIMCLRIPYQNDVEYLEETVKECKSINKKFNEFLAETEAYVDGESNYGPIDESHLLKCLANTRNSVEKSFRNNFNCPETLICLNELMSEVNKQLKVNKSNMYKSRSPGVISACSSFVARILNILGIEYPSKKALITSSDETTAMLSHVVDALVKFRSNVRLYALTTGESAQPQYKAYTQEINSKEITDTEQPLPVPPSEPPDDKGDTVWTIKKLTPSEQIQLQRMEREPLMKACDDVRNELFIAGVKLKVS
ncbi:probable cysteine--tRNA ligase, mitochondrial isoform X1 [Centruroides sculpturatus]|uniref:probable cysteine--tRNA ligase, mitochondrial isoform X1 n=2 Tax=Centruroides sculpturatus TaxID=218467 RepID=UPI000C6ED306|nr:probable cysteine--tRNA ligase, mitochondrial isoform X1 [Centruroides sculpturatus]XP_023230628.1 probable cysteine--tRNA ligase, mitochondrial isoform X1 [Centruroides sculpturatus]